MYCEKCGKEVDNTALVCGYCGHAIPHVMLSEETKKNLKDNERSDESLKTNHNANIRGAGYVMMALGGVCDLQVLQWSVAAHLKLTVRSLS